MQKLLRIMLSTVLVLAVACSNDEDSDSRSAATNCSGNTITLASGDTLRSSGTASPTTKIYNGDNIVIPADANVTFRGLIRVPSGCTLTINEGVNVTATAVSTQFTAVLIERGAKIQAIGTASKPITFTVSGAIAGTWGGIVIHGSAPVYVDDTGTTGDDTEILTGPYGGSNANDDSGTLRYVKIFYSGYAILPNQEYNGLFLAGVGRGTDISYIQSHRGTDDAIEIFGGTVDVSYLILTSNEDDGFDIDEGWTGTASYVITAQDTVTGTGQAIEYDGLGAAAISREANASNGVLSNFTMVGQPNTTEGAISIRDKAGIRLYNSYIAHFWGDNGIIAVDTSSTTARANSGASIRLAFQSNFVECLYTAAAHTGAYTDGNGDALVCAAVDPANCSSGALTLASAFPDGNTNNVLSNLDCSAAAVIAAGAGTRYNDGGNGAGVFKATVPTVTLTDPPAAPNGTNLAIPTYAGALNASATWADSWPSYPN